MKWIYGFFIILCFSRFHCSDPGGGGCMDGPCGFTAIVRDLKGLDGCGFALELEDSSMLIPQRLVYVQAPDPNLDPAYYFDFKDGERVCFGYRETDGADACMTGQLIFLTCIRSCDDGNSGDN